MAAVFITVSHHFHIFPSSCLPSTLLIFSKWKGKKEKIEKLTLVSIISNPRISTLVRPRETDQSRARRLGSRARNLQLMASRVKLSTRIRVGAVQRNDLMPDQIGTGLEAGRDGVLVVGGGGHEGGLCFVVSINQRFPYQR